MDELKPCPFCGTVPSTHKHSKQNKWRLIHHCRIMGLIQVGLMSIDWTVSHDKLVERWNMRAEAENG
jgi:hypothetical protein